MSQSNDGAKVRISLTSEQASLVKTSVGRDATAIELTVQELEQRIVPTLFTSTPLVPPSGALAPNSNETLLVG
jgi:hypothetical protein